MGSEEWDWLVGSEEVGLAQWDRKEWDRVGSEEWDRLAGSEEVGSARWDRVE